MGRARSVHEIEEHVAEFLRMFRREAEQPFEPRRNDGAPVAGVATAPVVHRPRIVAIAGVWLVADRTSAHHWSASVVVIVGSCRSVQVRLRLMVVVEQAHRQVYLSRRVEALRHQDLHVISGDGASLHVMVRSISCTTLTFQPLPRQYSRTRSRDQCRMYLTTSAASTTRPFSRTMPAKKCGASIAASVSRIRQHRRLATGPWSCSIGGPTRPLQLGPARRPVLGVTDSRK